MNRSVFLLRLASVCLALALATFFRPADGQAVAGSHSAGAYTVATR